MAWAWRHDLSLDWLFAGWQENCSQDCRRNSGEVFSQVLSTRGHSVTSAGGLVVDRLIGGLYENSCYIVGCADDIALVFSAEST